MHSENGFNNSDQRAQIQEVLFKNLELHDLWTKVSGARAEAFFIRDIDHVGVNHQGNISGLAKVILATAGEKNKHGQPVDYLTSESCFVLSPDLQEVKCFETLPGFSVVAGPIPTM